MAIYDKLGSIVPYSIISMILGDDRIFKRFINKFDDSKRTFGKISKEDYVDSLNQYMEAYIKLGKDLPKSYFDKLLYINHLYKVNKQYNYKEYLDRTDRIIPISFLESILTEEEVLEKFLNFYSNRELFPEDLEVYLNALSNLMTVYKTSGIQIPKNMEFNFSKLERIYIYSKCFIMNKLMKIIN